MPTLVIGATSQIGRFVLPALVARGESVVALTRAGARFEEPGVVWRSDSLESLGQVQGIGSVLSFGPMDALADWLSSHPPAPGIAVVATSSMSVASKRASHVPADRRVAEMLAEGESALREACARVGARLALLRPTMIYGAGLDRNLTPIARRAAAARFLPVPLARGLRQPVHAADVADAAIAARDVASPEGELFELGGGERLPVADMFRRLARSLPRAILEIPVPMMGARLVAGLVPGLRGPVSRLETHLVAENARAVSMLGVRPRGFEPTPATWGLEAS